MPGTARFPGLDWRFDASTHLALAEAMGHAWIQSRCGGSVSLVTPANRHPWWAVLRDWLPSDAPVRIQTVAGGTIDVLPERPYPPVEFPCLRRDGRPTWDPGLGIDRTLDLLAEQESRLVIERRAQPHPAVAVALAAISGGGWRCVWQVPMLTPAWDEALTWIGRRLLPLTLIVDQLPAGTAIPEGWWMHRPATTGDTAAALQWQLQHDWPGIIVPSHEPGAIPDGWLPTLR